MKFVAAAFVALEKPPDSSKHIPRSLNSGTVSRFSKTRLKTVLGKVR
jgi:hypothetical protein